MMSKEKYPSIFSGHIGAIVFIILPNSFRNTLDIFETGVYLRPIVCERKYFMDYKYK